MCITPKMPDIKNIIPHTPQQVDNTPDPVRIDKEGQSRAKRRRNPLRINLGVPGGQNSGGTGVNI